MRKSEFIRPLNLSIYAEISGIVHSHLIYGITSWENTSSKYKTKI